MIINLVDNKKSYKYKIEKPETIDDAINIVKNMHPEYSKDYIYGTLKDNIVIIFIKKINWKK